MRKEALEGLTQLASLTDEPTPPERALAQPERPEKGRPRKAPLKWPAGAVAIDASTVLKYCI